MRNCKGCSLILFLLIPPLWAQEEVLLPVPFYIDGAYSGEIDLRINGRVLIQPYPLFRQLEPYLDGKKLESLWGRWAGDEWVSVESLAGTPIKAEFDETLLLFRIEIPPESRRPSAYSLTREKRAPPSRLTPPARLSGVLNMEGWTQMDYGESLLRYELGPELGVNFVGYVLEAKGGLRSEGDILFLDYLRGIKDFPALSLRTEAGDLTYGADGFSQGNLVGIAAYRKTSLDMYYQTRPELGRTIFFPEPTEVEIRINDRTVRRKKVSAGTWTFSDFPLVQGPNEVELLWSDSAGDHRENFFQIYDSALLKGNETDWGGALGTDSWNTLNPALLLHLSRGLSDRMTAGLSVYSLLDGSLFSFQAPLYAAFALGTFGLIPEAEIAMDQGFNGGVSLNHSFSEKRENHFRQSFGSSLSLRYETFPLEAQRYSARAYYNYLPLPDLSFTPSASWSYEAVRADQGIDLSLRIRKSGGDGSTVSTELGVVLADGEWSPKAALTYSASFPEINQNLYARGDLSGQKMSLAWNRYNRANRDRDYSLGASAVVPAQREERFSLSLNGGYIDPRFSINLSQGFNAFFDEEAYANTTTLSAGSALVYADGVLTYSRPLRSSFVIVDSRIGPLEVNPTARGSLLSLDGREPGLIRDLSPYRYTVLRLSPENLPVGSDINDYTTAVYPSYRSGTLIRVEEKIYMYAGGILSDGEGRPLPLVLGEIRPVPEEGKAASGEESGRGKWPREFFTDGEGYFECYGLEPGEYLLTLQNRGLSFAVQVRADESGYYDWGVVKPED